MAKQLPLSPLILWQQLAARIATTVFFPMKLHRPCIDTPHPPPIQILPVLTFLLFVAIAVTACVPCSVFPNCPVISVMQPLLLLLLPAPWLIVELFFMSRVAIAACSGGKALLELVFFQKHVTFYRFVISLDFNSYFFVFSSKFCLVVPRIHTHICMYS